MGSGKSTVGKTLAKGLGLEFIDLDHAVESTEGRKVYEIFAGRGEKYFRERESALLRSLSEKSDILIACGGGTPCYNANMEYMNSMGITVYLEMSAGALLSRLRNSTGKRPLIEGMNETELEAYIEKTLDAREKWYKKARLTVGGLNPDITQLSSLLRAQDLYNL